MAARKKRGKNNELASQVQAIFADAMHRVRGVVEKSIAGELEALSALGKTVAKGARRVGRPAKAKKTKGRRSAKRSAAGSGKPGRKPSWSPVQVDRLVEIVKKGGQVAPKDVRKQLKVTGTQLAGMVRTALTEGRIKVMGKGRGTKYTPKG